LVAVNGGAADLPSAEAIFRNVRRFLPTALSVAAADDKQVCDSLAIASELALKAFLLKCGRTDEWCRDANTADPMLGSCDEAAQAGALKDKGRRQMRYG
jgi:hypothetical protein